MHELVPGRRAPGHARTLVRAACAHWPDDDVDVALVLTSELVTNAVVHAPGEVSIRVACEGVLLTVEVFDGGVPLPPRPGAAVFGMSGTLAESGRGLTLIETLADGWGVREGAEEDRKAVWFELRAHAG